MVVKYKQDTSRVKGRELDLLHALNAAAATLQKSAHSEEHVMSTFRDQITGLGLRGGLGLLDRQGEMLSFHAVAQADVNIRGLDEIEGFKAEGYQIPIRKVEIYRDILERGEAVFVPESRKVMSQLLPDLSGQAAASMLNSWGSTAAIYAPLKAEGRVFGLLYVAGDGLTPADVPAVEAFANHVSVALENARLFAALRLGEDRYRNLIEYLPLGVSRTTTGQNGKVIMANPAFLEMFGYTSIVELEGVLVSDLYVDLEERQAYVDNLLLRGSVKGVELQMKKKDGTKIWASITASVIDNPETNEPMYFDCVVEDITERIRVEEELFRQAEELATLHAITLDITAALALPSLLQTIVRRAARLLRARGGSLALCDAHLQEARIYAEFYPGIPDQTGKVFKYGEDVIGMVAETGKALLIDDYHDWPGRITNYEHKHPYSAVLSVPMSWQGQVTGVLQVMDDVDVRLFTQSDLELLTLFANQAAIAVQNARLLEAERRRLREAETLRSATEALTSTLDPDQVLNAILVELEKVVPYDCASVFLREGQRVRIVAARGFQDMHMVIGSEFAMDELLTAAKEAGHAIILADAQQDARFSNWAATNFVHGWLGVPLIVRGDTIGFLTLDNKDAGTYDQSHANLAETFANQAAIALFNARLFEAERVARAQAATERRHLSLLYEVGHDMAASLDTNEILRRATTLTCQALGGLLGEAFRFVPEKNLLVLRSIYGREDDNLAEFQKELTFELGVGLTGWVAQHREAVNVPDITEDQRWKHIPGIDQDVRSALFAPILQGDRLLGVLAVFHQQTAAFSTDHLDLMRAICHQVSMALSNAERYQQVQRLVDQLEVEQRRLDNLVERLPVGVLLLDEDYRVLVANSLGNQILGLLGTVKMGDILTTLGPYNLAELVDQYYTPLPVEFNLAGVPQRVFEAQIRPLGPDQSQWVITIREVTEEREIQTRIQMQDRLATVGQLASGIAHDFNNIMAAIMVYTDLLKKDLAFLPSGSERMAIIQQQVHRATSLIRQILDFSRRSVMEQIHMDMLPFIKELDKLLERVLPETIRLELSYKSEEYWVKADPTRLQQVFMNLAVNARDAMSNGGTIFFELDRIQLTAQDRPPFPSMRPGEWVRIQVRDTGIGIPPDNLPHIFEPFFTTKPVGEGTGLGLAQAYGIVKQHDGFIIVNSQVGEGTIFTIYLPALPISDFKEVIDVSGLEIEGEGETILVVEDDGVTLVALRDLLESQNYHVLMATNGVEALDIFEQNEESVNLVVCDVVMPEMGGVELYHSLRKDAVRHRSSSTR